MQTQAESRAAKRKQKDLDRQSDENNDRGFSTDQQISMIGIKINKQRLMHQHNEQKLVAMSVEASILYQQLDSAERRAEHRCPEYNKDDANWKIVDDLIDQQNKVNTRICDHNMTLMMPEGDPWTATEFSDIWNEKKTPEKTPEVEVTKKAKVVHNIDSVDEIIKLLDIDSEIIDIDKVINANDSKANSNSIAIDLEEGKKEESSNDDSEDIFDQNADDELKSVG